METALTIPAARERKQPQISGFKYFYPERPRLIHVEQPLFKQLSEDPRWIAEPKYDGKRLQLHHLPDGEFQFWGRHGEKLVYTPSPEVLDALAALHLKGYWLFDGELRHGKVPGVSHRIALYDVFIASGNLLVGVPFIERRESLEILWHYADLKDGMTLDLAPQFNGNFRETFNWLIQEPEFEGLVLKNLNGILDLGRARGNESTWMKKVRRPSNRWRF